MFKYFLEWIAQPLIIVLLCVPIVATGVLLYGIHIDSFALKAIGGFFDIVFVGIVIYIMKNSCIG